MCLLGNLFRYTCYLHNYYNNFILLCKLIIIIEMFLQFTVNVRFIGIPWNRPDSGRLLFYLMENSNLERKSGWVECPLNGKFLVILSFHNLFVRLLVVVFGNINIPFLLTKILVFEWYHLNCWCINFSILFKPKI